jgi:hypothetical protein
MIIEKGTLVIIKQNNLPFYLGLSNNKNELMLLNPYPSNNKKTMYISKHLVNCNFHNANWASEIALRGVFSWGDVIICDEPRYKNVDAHHLPHVN